MQSTNRFYFKIVVGNTRTGKWGKLSIDVRLYRAQLNFTTFNVLVYELWKWLIGDEVSLLSYTMSSSIKS